MNKCFVIAMNVTLEPIDQQQQAIHAIYGKNYLLSQSIIPLSSDD